MPSNGKHRKKRGSRHKKDFQDRAATFTSEDVISKTELEGDDVLSLPVLRTKSITEIQETAEEMGIENISRARRQDITFNTQGACRRRHQPGHVQCEHVANEVYEVDEKLRNIGSPHNGH